MTPNILCTCNIYVQQPKDVGVYAAWCATHCLRTHQGNMRPVAKVALTDIPEGSYVRRVEGSGLTKRYVTLKVNNDGGKVALSEVKVSLPSAFHQNQISPPPTAPIERPAPSTLPNAPTCSMDDLSYRPSSPLSYADVTSYKATSAYDATSVVSMRQVSGRRPSATSMQSIISKASRASTAGFVPMEVDSISLSSSVGSATSLNLSTIIEASDEEHSPSDNNIQKILDIGINDYAERQSKIMRDSTKLLSGSGATYDKLIIKNQEEMNKFHRNKAEAKRISELKDRMVNTIASRFLFEEWDIRMLTQIRDQTIREFVKEKVQSYTVLDIMYVVEGVLVEHGTATARLDAIAHDDTKMLTMINSHKVANNIISSHHEKTIHKVCRKIVAKLPWQHANISMVSMDLGNNSEQAFPLK